jgi:nonribosomal peptide synthetase protein BlmVII
VRDPERLWQIVRDQQVTVFSATPTAFHSVLTAAASGRHAVRTVVLGGERCEPAKLRTWLVADSPDRPTVVNMYGITETTVHVTWRPLTAADANGVTSPVGRPIPGAAVYVVDHAGVPTAPGGVGEFYVGGHGVARGYLNRPGLTADRFRPDDLGGRPGARLYRSGDVGRVQDDGGLVYLGRADQQLKIRGYRIEPGEVEAALVEHPGVAAAAVCAAHVAERACLVGYVVPAPGGEPPTAAELRRHLIDRLPAYLVPAAYAVLERLPLTRNGKLDRTALTAMPATVASTDDALPRSATERALAAVWCELLNLSAVGIHDDFFELGGDSLLVTRLHARLHLLFGVELPMRRLYQALDIATQAAAIEDLGGTLLETREDSETPASAA